MDNLIISDFNCDRAVPPGRKEAGTVRSRLKEIELNDFENAGEFWNSQEKREEIVKAYIEFLSRKKWISFITLTFKDETPPDVANRLFFHLVKCLNKEVFGEHYTRIVSKSYFSYSKALEYQRRGIIHFHVLIDRPVDFKLIHKIWNQYAGFAHTSIIKDNFAVRSYVSKYNLKGGQIDVYFAKKCYNPLIKPAWWLVSEEYEKPEN